LWLRTDELLHVVDGHCVWTLTDGMDQSDPAPRRSARHAHWDCGIHFGADFSTEPRIRPATDYATWPATESASESASHGAVGCRTRPGTVCGADGAINCALVCRADFRVLRRLGFGGLPGAEIRVKSLIDGHIDGRAVFGVECQSHPRVDPPVAGASASLSPRPQAMPGSSSASHTAGPFPARRWQRKPMCSLKNGRIAVSDPTSPPPSAPTPSTSLRPLPDVGSLSVRSGAANCPSLDLSLDARSGPQESLIMPPTEFPRKVRPAYRLTAYAPGCGWGGMSV
jgi:hypothetical protein